MSIKSLPINTKSLKVEFPPRERCAANKALFRPIDKDSPVGSRRRSLAHRPNDMRPHSPDVGIREQSSFIGRVASLVVHDKLQRVLVIFPLDVHLSIPLPVGDREDSLVLFDIGIVLEPQANRQGRILPKIVRWHLEVVCPVEV